MPPFLSSVVAIFEGPMRSAVVVIAIVAVLCALSVSSQRGVARRYPRQLTRHVVACVQQAARLGVMGEQDENPLVALLHATSALAHVRIARGIMCDHVIRERTGCNPEELEFVLDRAQATAMQSIAATSEAHVRSASGMGPATGWLGDASYPVVAK